jgi:para-nitrobenzyl esterase
MGWRRSVLSVGWVLGLLATGVAAPAASAGSAGSAGDPAGRSREVVHTDSGPVRGSVHDGFRLFQGIPFAAPPLGELRWRPPRPPARWREPLDATAPRSACAQPASAFGTPASLVEDCLYLNVTTPHRPGRRPLPVMVWIHGGSYVNGSGASYNASRLALEGDVVVVTVNYRLGALGFLALPALTGEQPGIQSGNYGIEDQQAALRWVRRNALAFGGDPRNVTIFGESAGAGSVCAHLVSPTAAGLFHRAIGQSFSCAAPARTSQAAETAGTAFAAGHGCADPAAVAACLRGKPVADLLRGWPGGGPVVGGREVPVQPPDGLRTDRFHHVPLLLGNTLDEMRLFVSLQFDAVGRPVTPQQYEQIIRATYGANADAVLARYPVASYPSPSIALATVQTDAGTPLSTCVHLTSYRLAMAHPRPVPVYGYQFVDRTAPPLVDVPNFDEGAEHAVELNFLFPNLFGRPLTEQQLALARTMVRYWTNFAHHGNPNGPGVPAWHRFRSADDVLALGIGPGGVRPVDIARASNCDFWGSVG